MTVEIFLSGVAILISLIALFFSNSQVKEMKKQVKVFQEQAERMKEQVQISFDSQIKESVRLTIDIENQIVSRKVELDKATKAVREAHEKNENIEIISDFFETTKENYFNSLDRLCYFIDKKLITDRDFKIDYRNTLKKIIDTYPKDFDASSEYHNIIKINKEWQTS